MNTSERTSPVADAADAGAPVRRWEAPDVGRGGRVGGASSGLLTAEQLAAIEEQAREEGFRRGLDEGRRAGEQEVRRVAQRLQGLLRAIDPYAGVLDETLMEQLADLVLAVSRQFVRRELAREPGEIVRVVREAMTALPVSDALVRLHLNPEDVRLVRDALPMDSLERRLSLVDDLSMTRGGVRLETDVSAVDATVETRLNAIASRLFGDERAAPAVPATAGPEGGDPPSAGAPDTGGTDERG